MHIALINQPTQIHNREPKQICSAEAPSDPNYSTDIYFHNFQTPLKLIKEFWFSKFPMQQFSAFEQSENKFKMLKNLLTESLPGSLQILKNILCRTLFIGHPFYKALILKGR